jgi:hypothetical protein
MIQNYERPQSTIANNLAIAASGMASRFRALAVGPQYRLNRFGQDTIPSGKSFLSAGQTLDFEYLSNGVATALPSTDLVDLASVSLYGEGLEALLASFTNGTSDKFYLNAVATPHILNSGTAAVKGTGLCTSFRGRPVTVGDIVYISDGVSGTKRRTVVGLQGAAVDATYGANTAKDDTNAGNSAYNPTTSVYAFTAGIHPTGKTLTVTGTFDALVRGSKVADKYGEDFIITVLTGGTAASGLARVSVSSASGLWSAATVTPTNSSGDFVITTAELAGLTATIDTDSAALVAGEVFTFRVVGAYARLGNTQLDVSDTGLGFTGSRDTTYIVTVTEGSTGGVDGAVVSVMDTTGIDTPQTGITVVADTYFPVGSFGLQMKFVESSFPTQGGLRAGDAYFVHAAAATQSTTVFDKVVLDGPAVNTSLFADTSTALASVSFRLTYTGRIEANAAADEVAWVASDSGIAVDTGLSLFLASRDDTYEWCPFIDGVGTLSPSYRSLVPRPPGGDRFYVESVDDIVANAGPIDLDNDLAFGLSEMLGGSQGRGIYGLAVTTNDEAGFADALALLESTDEVYSLGIVTNDLDVMLAAKAHVGAMCQKDVKNWRKAYVGTDSPGTYPVLQLKADGITNYTATISDNGGSNVLVSTEDDVDFRTLGLVAGDRVLFGAAEYVLGSVVSATELLLQAGPTNPVSPAAPFQLWKADTVQSQKAFVNQRAAALGTELVCHVWSENATRYINDLPTVIPGRYLACEIAGLRSALFAQQGLTRTEVSAVTAAPNMYLRYRKADLDNIAANGTFIVTQDSANGAVFIRHQVTTETGKGSLYYEDSATVILHSVDFATKDIIDPMIGKFNATQPVADRIKNSLIEMLREKTRTLVADIGPELISYRDLVVEIHPVLRDRIRVSGILTIPLPLNNVDVVWNAEVSLAAVTA